MPDLSHFRLGRLKTNLVLFSLHSFSLINTVENYGFHDKASNRVIGGQGREMCLYQKFFPQDFLFEPVSQSRLHLDL